MLTPLLSAFDIEWSREMMYLICAVVGGAVIVLQTLLLLFGFGGMDDVDGIGDADVHLDGSEGAFGFLSVRAVAAFLCFFGLAGWGATTAGWGVFPTIGIALLCGLAIMFVVVAILGLQKRLYSEGNLHPEQIVGEVAKVYLRIPAHGQGKGKVTVTIQGRTEQYSASSLPDCEEAIPNGAAVRLVRMITPGSFEVERV